MAMVGTPDVTSPPRPRSAGRGYGARRRAPVLVAALVTTLWAAAVSYAVVVAAVALVTHVGGDGLPVRGVFRFASAGWLLAHGVPLVTGGGRLDLAPLAVTVLAGWRIVRAGVHTARAIGARRARSIRLAALAAG